ncbi:MAG: DUF2931 family protein, partial [Planctomycetaceae bacterium]|nr:DUF2931 family protein [Planctomycetaceae bacterium]
MARSFNTIGLVLFLITLISCETTGAGNNMKKFAWQASESAPKKNLMEIVSGSLFYHDGSGSLYVPNRVALHNGWGKGRSSHVVGDDL